MQYGAGSAVVATGGPPGFQTDIYLSGTTFFTLGLGDVIPRSGLARALVVTEAGFGFGFLAAIIGYLPFIYGSFSQREGGISPARFPRRHAAHGRRTASPAQLRSWPGRGFAFWLKDWELWCAELMESHLSYPVLAYFRSQHDNHRGSLR